MFTSSAAKTVPVSPATPAPNAKASNFSQFTGIPSSCAAIESSRIERQALPVRDWLTSQSTTTTATNTTRAT